MMSEKSLVSILMNCYNGEKYLSKAIESVLNQTYQEWEIIFWDNQSTDFSATIFKRYKDSRLRYFLAPNHTDLGAARILAFKEALGEFVAILDVDDTARSDRLERQVAFLEHHPEVALVGSWVNFVDVSGKLIFEFKPPSNTEELYQCLGWTNPIVNSSSMYRSRIAKNFGGYSDKFMHSQDFCLVLNLATHFKIAVIDDFLCDLMVSSSSLSRSTYRVIAAQEAQLLFQYSAERLSLSQNSMLLNSRSIAIIQVKLGIYRILDGEILNGLKQVVFTLINQPSALWGNGLVRRFFGKWY
jgi:glycosyltransferase involved in cell wall biosynthesis